MQRIKHRNIVRFIDSFTEGDYLYLVMEYCDRGDLSMYLNRLDSMMIPESKLWKFFLQLLSSMSYIHNKSIIHGDLKPQNILLHGRDYDAKLTDFGISQSMAGLNQQCFEAAGSLAYCSPELLNGEPYNQKTDVWALGCILYEMITKQCAFKGGNEQAII